jgi:hypothetical protein
LRCEEFSWIYAVHETTFIENASPFKHLGTTVTNENLIQEEIKGEIEIG